MELENSLSKLLLKTSLFTGTFFGLYKLAGYIRSSKIPDSSEILKILKKLKYEANYLGGYIFSEVIRDAITSTAQGVEMGNDEIEEIIQKHVKKKIYVAKFSKIKTKILKENQMSHAKFETYMILRKKKVIEEYKAVQRFNIDEILKKYKEPEFRFPPTWNSERVLYIFTQNDMDHLAKILKHLKKNLKSENSQEIADTAKGRFSEINLEHDQAMELITQEFKEIEESDEIHFVIKEHPLVYLYLINFKFCLIENYRKERNRVSRVIAKLMVILTIKCQEILTFATLVKNNGLLETVKDIEKSYFEVKKALKVLDKEREKLENVVIGETEENIDEELLKEKERVKQYKIKIIEQQKKAILEQAVKIEEVWGALNKAVGYLRERHELLSAKNQELLMQRDSLLDRLGKGKEETECLEEDYFVRQGFNGKRYTDEWFDFFISKLEDKEITIDDLEEICSELKKDKFKKPNLIDR